MSDKYILVIDMDGTAIGCDADLTPQIVDFAARTSSLTEERYAGFYVCTARSTSEFLHNMVQYTAPNKFNEDTSNPLTVRVGDQSADVDLNYFLGKFLHRAAENFSLTTGLKLLEVSTADDVYYSSCGEAYNSLILQHEKALIESIDEDQAILDLTAPPCHPRPIGRQEYKNTQLRQIAEHAQLLFPGHIIRLVFVDDLYHNCVSALKAVDNMEGVSMRVMYFNNLTRQVRNIHNEIAERDAIQKGVAYPADVFDVSQRGEGAAASSSSTEELPRVMFIL